MKGLYIEPFLLLKGVTPSGSITVKDISHFLQLISCIPVILSLSILLYQQLDRILRKQKNAQAYLITMTYSAYLSSVSLVALILNSNTSILFSANHEFTVYSNSSKLVLNVENIFILILRTSRTYHMSRQACIA